MFATRWRENVVRERRARIQVGTCATSRTEQSAAHIENGSACRTGGAKCAGGSSG
jgi:hypothetical protein